MDPATDPSLGETLPGDHDNRVLDLATGFALGELSDDELREFYDRLREPGEAGQRAGEVAWEALGVCMDLRSQMGTTFQDALFIELSESGEAGTARFAAKVRNRLGHSRPRLQPVAAPETTTRRRSLPVIIAVVIALALATLPWILGSRPETVATVAAVVGSVTREGQPVIEQQGIDRRDLMVADGAQLTLTWDNGSRATFAGPAAVVAGPSGFSLLAGRAWCRSEAGFTIGLPDRSESVDLDGGAELAIEIRENRSTLGLIRGRIDSGRLKLEPDQAVELAQPTSPYPWRSDALDRGAEGTIGASQARWQLHGTVVFEDTEAAVLVRGRLGEDHTVEVAILPTSASLRIDGKELQRVTLSGAPLAERDLVVNGQGQRILVTIAGMRIDAPLPSAPLSLAWDAQKGHLRDATLRTGPGRQPPFAVTR